MLVSSQGEDQNLWHAYKTLPLSCCIAAQTANVAPTASGPLGKRKADATDAAPDNKRPTFSSGAGARPTRSNTTGGAGGRTTSLQGATSARTGPSAGVGGSELGPIAEETWDDIRDKTGQGVDDVLNKKLSFPKGTKPERKVEAFVPLVKELKCVCGALWTKGEGQKQQEQECHDALKA